MIIWGVMRLVDSGKYRPTAHSVVVLATLLMMLLHALLAFGQKAEYESYFEFRTVLMPKVQEENHWSLTKEQVYEKYGAKLQSDRIAESHPATAVSHTPPWLPSGWGCRGRRLSRERRNPGMHSSPWRYR